jgi:hypothetical protein
LEYASSFSPPFLSPFLVVCGVDAIRCRRWCRCRNT